MSKKLGSRDSPGTEEHAPVLSSGLQDDGDCHDEGSDPDGWATTEAIGEVWREGISRQGTNVLPIAVSVCVTFPASKQLTWMALRRPSLLPAGVSKKSFQTWRDWKLLSRLPSKPFVDEVINLNRQCELARPKKHPRTQVLTEARSMHGAR